MRYRKKFNWLTLDRTYLYKTLYHLLPRIIKKKISICKLQTILKKTIKQAIPVRVSSCKTNLVPPGQMTIGGNYYPDYDQQGSTYIEIKFFYHLRDQEILITKKEWQELSLLFADTVLHEIIHVKQYRSRKFKQINHRILLSGPKRKQKNQRYYGHVDEIDAYAFNIACEIYKKSKRNLYESKVSNQIYYQYLEVFDFDTNHPAIINLDKKIRHYRKYAIKGKPFIRNKFLTY